MDDEKILELYFVRDEQAVVETDRKYGRYCFTLANAILPSPEDAEEAVSDTYLHTWNAIPPRRPKVLRLFLARIVRNLSFDRWRHLTADKRGGGEVDLALEELGECVSARGTVEEHFSAKELARSVRQFLDTLPQRDRSIFLRRYFYVEEAGAIAQRYGMQTAAVRKVLLRTREKLRKYLQKEGYAL